MDKISSYFSYRNHFLFEPKKQITNYQAPVLTRKAISAICSNLYVFPLDAKMQSFKNAVDFQSIIISCRNKTIQFSLNFKASSYIHTPKVADLHIPTLLPYWS
ncbi:unnamed protein product [Cuscuta epithymum]|uniref:Uncharacterized protein n=1 Tax=Cuscuta epithymum TaxID=186058 RepID=A0AAV0GHI4_9ASTE|nr:unnamed protein product [Cuscuta epithymum]